MQTKNEGPLTNLAEPPRKEEGKDSPRPLHGVGSSALLGVSPEHNAPILRIKWAEVKRAIESAGFTDDSYVNYIVFIHASLATSGLNTVTDKRILTSQDLVTKGQLEDALVRKPDGGILTLEEVLPNHGFTTVLG